MLNPHCLLCIVVIHFDNTSVVRYKWKQKATFKISIPLRLFFTSRIIRKIFHRGFLEMIVIIVKRMIRKPTFRSDHANIWVWRLVWDLSGKVTVILIILIILIIPIIILSIILIILSIILIIIFFAVVIIMSMILLGRWAEVLATKFSGEGKTLTKFDLIVEKIINDKI